MVETAFFIVKINVHGQTYLSSLLSISKNLFSSFHKLFASQFDKPCFSISQKYQKRKKREINKTQDCAQKNSETTKSYFD